jgi:hypothetical protein
MLWELFPRDGDRRGERNTMEDAMNRTLLAFVMALSSSAALAAGQVEVSFKPADQLADVGRGSDRDRHVQALAAHFKSLGARLPDGQVLKVEVLDVDMAGELQPFRRGEEIRVMKGAADWPTMDLRWSLDSGGRTLGSGRERLSDMSYLSHPLRSGDTGAVAYEARMIDRWFEERVLGTKKAAP